MPAVPDVPVSRPGDLWLLGPPRLICGDTTDAAVVAQLLERVRPPLMVPDPVVGIRLANYNDDGTRHQVQSGGRTLFLFRRPREIHILIPGIKAGVPIHAQVYLAPTKVIKCRRRVC